MSNFIFLSFFEMQIYADCFSSETSFSRVTGCSLSTVSFRESSRRSQSSFTLVMLVRHLRSHIIPENSANLLKTSFATSWVTKPGQKLLNGLDRSHTMLRRFRILRSAVASTVLSSLAATLPSCRSLLPDIWSQWTSLKRPWTSITAGWVVNGLKGAVDLGYMISSCSSSRWAQLIFSLS